MIALLELKAEFGAQLQSKYSTSEIDQFFYWTVEDVLGLKRIDVSLNPKTTVEDSKYQTLSEYLQRLNNEEPIQYILGYTEFYGLDFNVNKNVLIPRPETEALVDWVINDCENLDSKTILDIGTGSGCIPVVLKKHLNHCNVYGLDISKKALEVAKANAQKHKVDIGFVECDILNSKKLPVETDIIVSNPPYVKQSEKLQMAKNVLDYEPHSALFVDDNDPLLFYKKIGELAQNNKRPTSVYFELNEFLKNDYESLIKGFDVKSFEFRKDFRGATRMLKCEF